MFKVMDFEPRVLSWWRTQRDRIDMEPPYQRRGRLWSQTDKAFLVDSVLNDFDVPKFYLADFSFIQSPLNEKRLPYAIIDGKQRFEAMFDFYDGKLTLDQEFVYREDPALALAGLGYADLRRSYPTVADKYDNFHPSVMRVLADSEEPINELFVRLNRSKPLTGAEIRNAMSGPVPRLVRELAMHELFRSMVRFPISRGQDKNAATKLLMFECDASLKETKKERLDRFVKDARAGGPKVELAARRVVEVLDQMLGIFLPRDSLLSAAGILPVYYWLVANTPTEQHGRLREFLVDFERTRKENRQPGRSKDPDRELVLFDQYNRSTNDERSHKGRFEILKSRFDGFVGRKQSTQGRR